MKIKKIVAITALMFTPILAQASGVNINPNPQGGSFDGAKEDAVIIGGQGSKSSTAIGVGTGVSELGVGVGFQAQADSGAIAVGANSQATRSNTVVGTNSIADDARDTIVIGQNSIANSTIINSVILGNNITASRNNELILGGKTIGGVLDAEFDDQAINLGQLKVAISSIDTGGSNPNVVNYSDITGNLVSFKGLGGTELRNVKAGTTDDSAVNLGQLKVAIDSINTGGGSTNPNAVNYDEITGDTVTFKGADGTELKNIKAGTTTTSAVNLGQLNDYQQASNNYTDTKAVETLNQANAYTDRRFSKLDKKIDSVSAMASAQSSIIYNPYGSQYQLGVGVGASGSESAISMKFMGATQDKSTIFSVGISKGTRGNASVGAGMTFSFN